MFYFIYTGGVILVENHESAATTDLSALFELGHSCAPKEKLFLLDLLLSTREFDGDVGTARSLQQKFGAKRHVVQNVMSGYLCDLGVVMKCRGGPSGKSSVSRGRPRIMFVWVGEEANRWLSEARVSRNQPYSSLAGSVLRCEGWRTGERLLLALLLARADLLGSVYGLRSRDVERLTGLKQARLKQTVGRLLEQGLLDSYAPGGSVSAELGTVTSSYQLNLNKVFNEIGESRLDDYKEGCWRVSLATGAHLTKVRALGGALALGADDKRARLARELFDQEARSLPCAPWLSDRAVRHFFGIQLSNPRYIELVAARLNRLTSLALVRVWPKQDEESSPEEVRENLAELLLKELDPTVKTDISAGYLSDKGESLVVIRELAGFLASSAVDAATKVFGSLKSEIQRVLDDDTQQWELKAASIFPENRSHRVMQLKLAFVPRKPVNRETKVQLPK